VFCVAGADAVAVFAHARAISNRTGVRVTGRAHEGRLFYEYFDWNLDGARWQSAAADALRTIGFRTDEWL
jgi:hypothetical protein